MSFTAYQSTLSRRRESNLVVNGELITTPAVNVSAISGRSFALPKMVGNENPMPGAGWPPGRAGL